VICSILDIQVQICYNYIIVDTDPKEIKNMTNYIFEFTYANGETIVLDLRSETQTLAAIKAVVTVEDKNWTSIKRVK